MVAKHFNYVVLVKTNRIALVINSLVNTFSAKLTLGTDLKYLTTKPPPNVERSLQRLYSNRGVNRSLKGEVCYFSNLKYLCQRLLCRDRQSGQTANSMFLGRGTCLNNQWQT